MTDRTRDQGAQAAAVERPRTLAKVFEGDAKQFEWIAKQYYDLFAYHAAQRLTAFNFFLVSLSFFSNAYATLVTRSGGSGADHLSVAAALAFAAYMLVVAFGRLDKRNEQIIRINERPLKSIQAAIRRSFDGGVDAGEHWETFRQAGNHYPGRTFGHILPFIYSLSAAAAAGGAVYAWTGAGTVAGWCPLVTWSLLSLVSTAAICLPLAAMSSPRDESPPPIAPADRSEAASVRDATGA